jgi:hypothetical protein
MEDAVRTQDPEIFTTEGKHPQYYIRPFVDTFDQNGRPVKRQQRVYLGRLADVGKRDAIKKKNEVMARINRSQVVLQAQLRLGGLLDYYIQQFVRNPEKLAASTRAKYETHIKKPHPPRVGRPYALRVEPLSPFRNQILVLSGIKANWNCSHLASSGSFLRGATHGGRNEGEIIADVSMDQILSRRFAKETKKASLGLSMDLPSGIVKWERAIEDWCSH